MKNPKSIDRSFQNHRNEVIETDVPRSGINMSYRSHTGGIPLGRLIPVGIQHVMPADKFNGSTEAKLYFERLSTPVVDTIDLCVHNFLVTNRSVDNRWTKFMSPTKLNNMNANVYAPMFNVGRILDRIALSFKSVVYYTAANTFSFNMNNLATLASDWDDFYCSDALSDLSSQLVAISGSNLTIWSFDVSNSDQREKFILSMIAIFNFFVGKGSLLDYLGYKSFMNPTKLRRAFSVISATNYLSGYDTSNTIHDILYNSKSVSTAGVSTLFFTWESGTAVAVNYDEENEIALRAYYAIWFEYYRNFDLEPRSNTLPEYHDFGGSTIFGSYTFADLHFLVPRIRSWQQDMFTTAGIDDISRHVFAPINSSDNDFSILDDASLESSGWLDNRISSIDTNYRDPKSGNVISVKVPIPARLISAFSSIQDESEHAIELQTLRKANMLENFLKRIYYGGDEYRDRMLHLYGARLEDYNINRPQWLSSSLDEIDPKQEVANTGVAASSSDPSLTPIGSRIATATIGASGSDGFTDFSSEFGVVITIMSVMPHATYDPYLLQNGFKMYADYPIPQFANSMEDVISTLEVARGTSHAAFGYAPYAHSYRGRVDEIHGNFHDSMYDYCFLRYWSGDTPNAVPNLSWSFLHCRPKLPMFVNSVLLDGQLFGTIKHNFLVERALPSPVETI